MTVTTDRTDPLRKEFGAVAASIAHDCCFLAGEHPNQRLEEMMASIVLDDLVIAVALREKRRTVWQRLKTFLSFTP